MRGLVGGPLVEARLLALLLWIGVALVVLCLGLAAAAILLRIRNNRVARRWSRYEAEWEIAVLDVLAGEPPETLQQRIGPREAAYFVGFLTRFGRQVRGIELDQLASLAQPFLPLAVDQLRAGSAGERARAVATLGLLGGPSHAGPVISALDDRSPLVAMTAAWALTRRHDARHAEPVLRSLHRLTNWRPGFLAAMLAALGPEAAPALRRTLQDSTSPPQVQALVADALGILADPGAAGAAAALAEQSDDPALRAACLRLLARVGGPEELPTARRMLHSPSEMVRIGAVQVLGTVGGVEDVPLLAAALEDESIWVAEHAARGLAQSTGRPLLQALASSETPRARLAREVLAEVGA